MSTIMAPRKQRGHRSNKPLMFAGAGAALVLTVAVFAVARPFDRGDGDTRKTTGQTSGPAVTAPAGAAAPVSDQEMWSAINARRLAEQTITVYLVGSEAERERLLTSFADSDSLVLGGGPAPGRKVEVVRTPEEEADVWRWVVGAGAIDQGTQGPSVQVVDLRPAP